MLITDQDKIISELRARVEEVENERDRLSVSIAEHVEALGGEGNDRTALTDSLGQIERLLNGKDLDAGLDLQGIAGQVEALVWLLKNLGGSDDAGLAKAEQFFARLDIGGSEGG